MGQRADALGALLTDIVEPGPKTPCPGAESIEAAGLTDEVQRTYARLGGVQPTPRMRPGAWDFTFENWVLELDEENHFNRYRATTLDSPSYKKLNSFDRSAYKDYCDRFERECNIHGGYWANSSAEREFGPAGDRGVLAGSGSPRWKQRAFYDYVKDLAPLTEGIAVSRLSVWDTLSAENETIEVDRILERAASEPLSQTDWPAVLLDLATSRIVRPT